MGQRDILLLISKLLNKNKINYLLTGSLAVSYYGYPRATHDIDFVIEIKKERASKIIEAMKKLNRDFLFGESEIKQAIQETSQFNLYHSKSGLKVDFWISKDTEFELNKFKRKKIIFINRQRISLVSTEDLILTKLLWSKVIRSERHLRDCAGILKIQKEKLNRKYLNNWAKKLEVFDLLKEASKMEY